MRLPLKFLEKQRSFFDKIIYPLLVLLFVFLVPYMAAIIGLPIRFIGAAVPIGQGSIIPHISLLNRLFFAAFLPDLGLVVVI